MAKPTEKAPEIDALLTELSGVDRKSQIEQDLCTWCKGPANEFRNDISRREYAISGFCQKCQDDTYGKD